MADTDIVTKILKEIEELDIHSEILKSTEFSETEKLREKKRSAIVKCQYICENERCDFDDCLTEISKHPKLLKYHSTDACKQIVRHILLHQNDLRQPRPY
jgi:hypothetical protein